MAESSAAAAAMAPAGSSTDVGLVVTSDDPGVRHPHYQFYLEAAAEQAADKFGYQDQGSFANKKTDPRIIEWAKEKKKVKYTIPAPQEESTNPVRIMVAAHTLKRCYGKGEEGPPEEDTRIDNEEVEGEDFRVLYDITLPYKGGLDRATLKLVSSTAHDFFTWNPMEEILRLPITYPRTFRHGRDRKGGDLVAFKPLQHISHVSAEPIERSIIPWLLELEKQDKSKDKNAPPPMIEIPDTILDKVHLYNAMLHLGILEYFKRPLVKELCHALYTNKLTDCELETIEHTIGRFNSRTVAVLDPILCVMAGSYAQRDQEDRNDTPKVDPGWWRGQQNPQNHYRRPAEGHKFAGGNLHVLEYDSYDVIRRLEPKEHDTITIAPEFPVLGHCINNWSGMHRDGRATGSLAHMGYPLHIGKMKYYKRLESGEKGITSTDDPITLTRGDDDADDDPDSNKPPKHTKIDKGKQKAVAPAAVPAQPAKPAKKTGDKRPLVDDFEDVPERHVVRKRVRFGEYANEPLQIATEEDFEMPEDTLYIDTGGLPWPKKPKTGAGKPTGALKPAATAASASVTTSSVTTIAPVFNADDRLGNFELWEEDDFLELVKPITSRPGVYPPVLDKKPS